MKRLESKLNIIVIFVVIVLLIIALFNAFSVTNGSVKNLVLKRTKGFDILTKSSSYNELLAKSKEKAKEDTNEVGVLRIEFEKVEIDYDKVYTSDLLAIGLRWFYSIFFLITMLSFFIYYIKGWLLDVALSKYQLLPVLFIELKDGKKDTLNLHYSI
ncbi:MAG: hypothetical protein K0S41_944 [Anaerocolumna sp.]|jgi:predicted Holliday junction resolvase-like endonuclease|nr:hypothetical protein [Anaerocolumna sp.]